MITNANIELRERNFDIVYDSQKIFRILMNIYAFPGKIHSLPDINLTGIDRGSIPVILPLITLMDLETSFSIIGDDAEETEKILKYLCINTGAKKKRIEEADYCVSLHKQTADNFNLLNKGLLKEPDRSATLFYLVNKISNSDKESLVLSLSGPGIHIEQFLSIDGLSEKEVNYWIQDRINYPLGIDIVLTDKNFRIIGLPRSTNIRIIPG